MIHPQEVTTFTHTNTYNMTIRKVALVTESSAMEEAKELCEHLLNITGAQWKLRIHENLGWHYNVFHGTISISVNFPASRVGSRSFTIMNSADARAVGCGHGELEVLHSSLLDLLPNIRLTLTQQKNLTANYIAAYWSNSKLNELKAL